MNSHKSYKICPYCLSKGYIRGEEIRIVPKCHCCNGWGKKLDIETEKILSKRFDDYKNSIKTKIKIEENSIQDESVETFETERRDALSQYKNYCNRNNIPFYSDDEVMDKINHYLEIEGKIKKNFEVHLKGLRNCPICDNIKEINCGVCLGTGKELDDVGKKFINRIKVIQEKIRDLNKIYHFYFPKPEETMRRIASSMFRMHKSDRIFELRKRLSIEKFKEEKEIYKILLPFKDCDKCQGTGLADHIESQIGTITKYYTKVICTECEGKGVIYLE